MFGSLIGWGFELVGIAAILVIGAFLVLRFVNRRSADNAGHYVKTQTGKVGDWFGKQDPAAQMRQAALDAAGELKTADDALEASEKLKNKLARQVESDTLQKGRLEAQISKALAEGKPDTDPSVLAKAKRVAELARSIKENNSQIELQATAYSNTLKNATKAAQQAKAALEEADRLKVDLQLGQQAVQLASMFQKYDPTAVNSKLAKIDQYRQAAQDQKDGFNAKLKVMADRSAALGVDDDDNDTDLVTPEAAEVLARLRGTTPAPTPTPSMS